MKKIFYRFQLISIFQLFRKHVFSLTKIVCSLTCSFPYQNIFFTVRILVPYQNTFQHIEKYDWAYIYLNSIDFDKRKKSQQFASLIGYTCNYHEDYRSKVSAQYVQKCKRSGVSTIFISISISDKKEWKCSTFPLNFWKWYVRDVN